MRYRAILTTILLAACRGQGGGRAAIPAPVAPAAEPEQLQADVQFMQDMVAHHAQALAMTVLVPARTGREDIRIIAQRIDRSQNDEIARMRRWLQNRGAKVPEITLPHAQHATRTGPLMPGMLTPDEMMQLESASGSEFDRLFLRYMIRHHEGALIMVAELFRRHGAGRDPELFRFASDVDADQRAEIRRLQTIQRNLQ